MVIKFGVTEYIGICLAGDIEIYVLKKENKLLDLYLNENISKEVYQQKNRNIQLEKNTI